jgi:hypothetical protein
MAEEFKRDSFLAFCTTLPDYTAYKNVVGSLGAQTLCHAIFDAEAKKVDAKSFWRQGNPNPAVIINPTTVIKLKEKKDKTAFQAQITKLFMLDSGQITVKLGQITRFMDKARNGTLRTELGNKLMQESDYYTAPAPTVPVPGAPPIPPKPSWMIARTKAKAWLKKGVLGDTKAFDEVVDTYCKNDGTWPLGPDHKILDAIWRKLVTGAPPYRGVVEGAMYPSSIGGTHVLKTFMTSVSHEALPAKGNTAWENWALFVFGATMRSQPFPDGNKRASRAAYAIIMASAEIPFRAPNNQLGGELASM